MPGRAEPHRADSTAPTPPAPTPPRLSLCLRVGGAWRCRMVVGPAPRLRSRLAGFRAAGVILHASGTNYPLVAGHSGPVSGHRYRAASRWWPTQQEYPRLSRDATRACWRTDTARPVSRSAAGAFLCRKRSTSRQWYGNPLGRRANAVHSVTGALRLPVVERPAEQCHKAFRTRRCGAGW
jgi:hypothetical protein